MNYWLLTTEYPPFLSGGIGTYCLHTGRMLASHGYNVTIFLPALELNADEIVHTDGYRLIKFHARKRLAKEFLGYSAYLSYEFALVVEEYCKTENIPDIVEAQEYNGIAYYVQQFQLLKYPLFKDLFVLITCHAPSFICLKYNQTPTHIFPTYWTGQMEIASIRSADAVVSPSRYLVGEMQRFYDVSDIKFEYLFNPFEDNAPGGAASRLQDPIICFSKLSPLKGTFEILANFDRLWNTGFSRPLRMLGGGSLFFHPEATTMQDLLSKKYHQRIKDGLLSFSGEVGRSEIDLELDRSSLVILPSLFDNLPYATIESLSKGCIVLASSNSGQKEIIDHGVTGFLFDPHNSADFDVRLNEVLSLPEASQQKIRHAAITHVQAEFNYKKIFDQKSSFIDQALAQKRGRTIFPFISKPNRLIPEVGSYHQPQNAESGLLSVVIPFYNMGEFVATTIQSVIDASFKAIEIVVVNDGSTDAFSLGELIKIEKIPGVRVIHQLNGGLANARNVGAKASKGEFLSFLDPDDYVDKDYYTKAIGVLRSYENVSFVGSWIRYFGNSQNTWPSFNPEFPYLLLHNMLNSSALVYKKSSFLQFGLNDERFIYGMEDWDSVISMVENNQRGVVLPEVLFNYRIRNKSMSRRYTNEKRLYLYNLIGEKHGNEMMANSVEMVKILNANGPAYAYDNPSMETDMLSNWLIRKLRDTNMIQFVKRNKTLSSVLMPIYKRLKK